jgi:hypothetical protein
MLPAVIQGKRRSEGGGAPVHVDGQPLDPRHDLYNHSPDGFEWGYHGSGPAQLALALCCLILRAASSRTPGR